jgi:RNase P protein component
MSERAAANDLRAKHDYVAREAKQASECDSLKVEKEFEQRTQGAVRIFKTVRELK